MGTLVKWLLFLPFLASLIGIFVAIEMFFEYIGLGNKGPFSSATENRIRTLRSKAEDWDELGRDDWADDCRKMAAQLEPPPSGYGSAGWKVWLWFIASIVWLVIYFTVIPGWLRNGEF